MHAQPVLFILKQSRWQQTKWAVLAHIAFQGTCLRHDTVRQKNCLGQGYAVEISASQRFPSVVCQRRDTRGNIICHSWAEISSASASWRRHFQWFPCRILLFMICHACESSTSCDPCLWASTISALLHHPVRICGRNQRRMSYAQCRTQRSQFFRPVNILLPYVCCWKILDMQ